MLRNKKALVVGVVVALVGIVAALGFAAWNVGTSLAAPLLQATTTPGGQNRIAANAPYAAFFLEHFASHLGLSTDQVKSAYVSAYNDTIDQMVKDGKLTQAEADQMKQKVSSGVANGNLPMFGPGFREKGFGFGFGRQGMMGFGLNEVAKALGVTQQDLVTELQAGKSIADIAKEKNVDLNQVKQTILSDFKAQLDTAVKNNRITQAQADQAYQNFSQKLDQMVTQPGLMLRPHNGPFKRNPSGTQTPSNSSGVGL